MVFDYFNNITFGQPWLLLLFIIIPFLIYWKFHQGKKQVAAIRISSTKGLASSRSWKNTVQHFPFVFRMLALSCIIIALARPQTKFDETQTEGEGIDIILCIDVSGSMTAQDFQPNRMEAAKKVAEDFVDARPNDRIGVVIFAGESFTQCPLTTDHYVLKSQIAQIRNGLLEDGTAIGSGLATSVDRLRNSKSKSKVVILLTDGINNGGLIDPSTAKEIAKAFKVKVYTIGVGTDGYAPTPVSTPLGIVMQNQKVSIDEKLLQNIAAETGGKYFRATDNSSLTKIYNDINQLEKSKVEVTTFHRYTEKFYPFIFAAMALLLIEIVLRYTLFKKFP
ncbi:MAG TPA: VWA domain-containing protein [Hanamia sp.]|jgi:Ca-activated chloride channel homolog|nr:VWA domain-containing protein [Hanamia sp.]